MVAKRAPLDARRLRLVRCKIARLLLGDLVELIVRCVRHMSYIIAQTSDAAPDGLVQRPREFGQAVPRASEPEVTISLDARKLAEPPRRWPAPQPRLQRCNRTFVRIDCFERPPRDLTWNDSDPMDPSLTIRKRRAIARADASHLVSAVGLWEQETLHEPGSYPTVVR